MRKVLLLALLVATATTQTACTVVNPGFVGVKVNNYGTQRGVQDIPIVTGRVFYNPITESVYEFPTFLQNRVWEKDAAITFNSLEGAQISVDVGTSVSFEADKVPHIFIEQRKDPDHIIDIYVHNKIRDAFSVVGSKMRVTDIYGAGKQTLLTNVKFHVDSELKARGYLVEQPSIIGKMRLDPNVETAINSALAASQKAIEARNKVAESTALADQRIADARGDSAAAVIRASGQAAANNKLQLSLTTQLIQYEAQKKWDGKLPTYTGGGAVPFINIGKP